MRSNIQKLPKDNQEERASLLEMSFFAEIARDQIRVFALIFGGEFEEARKVLKSLDSQLAGAKIDFNAHFLNKIENTNKQIRKILEKDHQNE